MLATLQGNLGSWEFLGIEGRPVACGSPGLLRIEREVTFGWYIAGDGGKASGSRYGYGVRGSNLVRSLSGMDF